MANTQGVLAERNHCSTHLELMFRFFSWASQLGRVPLPEEMVTRFGFTIATAYRWRNAWCDANGLPIPAPRPLGSRPAAFNTPAKDKPGGNRHTFKP